MIEFKKYTKDDYEAVCCSLIELSSRDRTHISFRASGRISTGI